MNCGRAAPGARAGLGITNREADVLKLVAEGLANKQIAARLRVSPEDWSKSTSRRCSARPASVRVRNWRSWRHSHRPQVVRRNT